MVPVVLGLGLTPKGSFADLLLASDWPPEPNSKLPSICHSAGHSWHKKNIISFFFKKSGLKRIYLCLSWGLLNLKGSFNFLRYILIVCLKLYIGEGFCVWDFTEVSGYTP